MPQIIILMGASGVGKSTYAKGLADSHRRDWPEGHAIVDIFSADLYPGLYSKHQTDSRGSKIFFETPTLDFSLLGKAHAQCLKDFIDVLRMASESDNTDEWLVMVDNTNTTAAEISPYIAVARAFGFEPEIHHISHHLLSASVLKERTAHIHGTPAGAIIRQQDNLDDLHKSWPPFWPEVFVVTPC